MESHETRGTDGGDPLPSCPLPGAAAQPLSWELGERIVADDATRRRARLTASGGRTTVSVFEATDHTAVVARQTPVGRRKYYEVPVDDVERALEAAADGDRWAVETDASARRCGQSS